MPFNRIAISIAVMAGTALTPIAWAASDPQHDSHHPANSAVVPVTQEQVSNPEMDMGMHAGAMPSGYADQMKAMQQMHDKLMAAKTPEERNALMTEQMKLIQGGMSMMGDTSADGTARKPVAMARRQEMMEQRMDMMHSMMQMMLDRMPSTPATQ